MGGIGTALTGAASLVGAFKKKDKSPQSYAASAPTQTPDQAEMSSFIKPYMKDWMTNPPKVSAPQYTPTKIAYGGSGGNSGQRQVQPSSSASGKGSGAFGGSQTMGTGGPVRQNGGSFAYNPGGWQNNPENAAIDAKLAEVGGSLSAAQKQAGAYDIDSLQAQKSSLQNQLSQYSRQMQQYGRGSLGGYSNNPYFQRQMSQYTSGINGQIADIDKKIAEANRLNSQVGALETQQKQLQGQRGPEEIYQPGSMNIPEAPSGMFTEGMGGGYEPGKSWTRQLRQIGSPIQGGQFGTYQERAGGHQADINAMAAPLEKNPYGSFQENDRWNDAIASIGQAITKNPYGSFQENNRWNDAIASIGQAIEKNPYGSFQAVDRTGQINEATNPLSDQSGRISAIEAKINQPAAQDYSNGLEGTVQNRLTQNMDRKVQEGFDANYLKDLAAQGIDPLNDAYKEAIRVAGADFNRLGLGGSGFELGNKYGDQADSITSKYLDSVANVARDVSLRGAEAARSDRFANASLQDQATAQAGNLAQQQSANQLTRLSSDIAREMQQKDLTNQALQLTQNQELQNRNLAQQRLSNMAAQDAANEANRQNWTQSDRALDLANKDLLQTQIRLGNQIDQQNEANRQNWTQSDRALDLANKELLQTQIGLGNQIDQQNEANRQNWTQSDRALDLANRDLLQQKVGLESSLDQADEANRQNWTQYLDNLAQQNRDNLKTQIALDSQLSQQDESNRQWWENKNTSDRQYDNSLERQNWQDNVNVLEWLAGRDDEAQKYNIAQQLGIDTQNIGYQQAALANIMNFINGQNAQAGMANANYWNGVGQANTANSQNQNNLANAVAGLGTMFNTTKTTAPVQGTSWATYLTDPTKALSALGSLFR